MRLKMEIEMEEANFDFVSSTPCLLAFSKGRRIQSLRAFRRASLRAVGTPLAVPESV